MDPRRNEDYGANPPAYNASYSPPTAYPMSYQGEPGKSDISSVYPPGGYGYGGALAPPPPGPGQVGGGAMMMQPPVAGQPDSPPEYREQEEGAAGVEEENCFNDSGIRRAFIRKVYLTLMLQLLVTVAIICAFIYWDTLREWTFDNYWFTYCMLGVVLVLAISLSCCGSLRRRVPINFLALGLFTIAEGVMLGSLAVFFEAEAVLWAIGATALVTFSLSVFAMQSKWDFTAASGSLWAFCWTLFAFAMLCAIMRSQYLYILYACLGTLLFSCYLVVDTQMMLGKNKYSLSPEEYVFAALSLYLDIVTLFLLLLKLISICR